MENTISFIKTVLLSLLLSGSSFFLEAQEKTEGKSTQDLSFLIGKWNIMRVYSPESDSERTMKGELVCEESLDGQFIKCRYEMERPGKIRALDVVYFNYNHIYGLYESIWLSSTWPIKGIMQIALQKNENNYTLNTTGQFKIENDVMEYVKGSLVAPSKDGNINSFVRKTNIRTSEYEEGVWHYHMIETAKRTESK